MAAPQALAKGELTAVALGGSAQRTSRQIADRPTLAKRLRVQWLVCAKTGRRATGYLSAQLATLAQPLDLEEQSR